MKKFSENYVKFSSPRVMKKTRPLNFSDITKMKRHRKLCKLSNKQVKTKQKWTPLCFRRFFKNQTWKTYLTFHPSESSNPSFLIAPDLCREASYGETSANIAVNFSSNEKSFPNIEFEKMDNIDKKDTITKESFLKMIDRGGLMYPSELVFVTTKCAVKMRDEISNDTEIRSLLMSFANPRDVFSMCFENRINGSEEINRLLFHSCEDEHSFLSFVSAIASTTFNFTAKNFLTSINDRVHDNRKRGNNNQNTGNNRKIKKLWNNSYIIV